MKLAEIAKTLEAEILVGGEDDDNDFFAVGATDLMSDLLAKLADGCLFLTGLTTIQAIRTAIVSGVGAVVFVRGKNPPLDVIALARQENIPILKTPLSMFVSCGRLHRLGMTGLDGNS